MDGIEIYFLKLAGKVRETIRITTCPRSSGVSGSHVGIQERNGSLRTLISVAPVQCFGNDVVESHVHVSSHPQLSSSDVPYQILSYLCEHLSWRVNTGLSIARWGPPVRHLAA